MNGVGLIGAIVVGIAAGWIAEQVMNRHHGLLTNLIVGLVGGLIGSFLAGFFNITFYGWIGSLLFATIGAIVLLGILGLFSRRSA
ncbi:MAG: GlsB/YeaQ/YmgE family stress response membrane protein [Caulobacteraceae bacterium]